MDLVRWLDDRGGVAHRSEAIRAGYSRRAQREARTLGRWWLASPQADPRLARAAERNARLACISAAAHRRLALLTPPRLLHLAVRPNADTPPAADLRLHRTIAFSAVPRHALVEGVPDMLAHIAGCLPYLDALVVWESALHTRLVTASTLRAIPLRREVARALAAEASALSESILETVLAHGLRRRGIEFRQQVPLAGHRVDFHVGTSLVVQTDGYEFHSDRMSRRRDIEHDARLHLDGFGVLRFDHHHVLERLETVLDRIEEAVWRSR